MQPTPSKFHLLNPKLLINKPLYSIMPEKSERETHFTETPISTKYQTEFRM